MNTLNTALLWHSLKIAVIPCLYHSKRPALQSWREFQDVLPRKSQLKAWFSNPGYNLAVICGWQNLVVIDIDDNTCEANAHLNKQHTYCVATLKGWHYYYITKEPARCIPIKGGDVKAHGGYVLAPPSIHPSGKHQYFALNDKGPCYILAIDSLHDILPEYTVALEQQRTKIQPKPYDAFADAMRPWTPGNGASIEDIKSKWTIADILGQDGGGRRWQTQCPLPGHDDVVASFTVYPDGHYFCFGCRCGGDVIDLYAALHQTDIAGAMREMSK